MQKKMVIPFKQAICGVLLNENENVLINIQLCMHYNFFVLLLTGFYKLNDYGVIKYFAKTIKL